jgi:threonine/homoserine/homoserine lactone efflux protein
MEKRSRLVLVGLAIVVAAFLYLVYVAGSMLRSPAERPLESRIGAAVEDER